MYRRYRKSMRMKGYHYGTPGIYFITICTYKKMCFLGEIKNNKIVLSREGEYVRSSIEYINTHYRNIHVQNYTIMPNHIHIIIAICGAGCYSEPEDDSYHYDLGDINSAAEPQTATIIDIIRNLKTYTGNQYYQAKKSILWQRGFYDHIIENEIDHARIENYINKNIDTWQRDKFYCETAKQPIHGQEYE